MSSSPSATVSSPRSPSPRTPEAYDYPDAVAIESDVGLSSSWYMTMAAKAQAQQLWGVDNSFYHTQNKGEDNDMLQLDELIEQDAYDDSPSPFFASSSAHPSPPTHARETLTHHAHPSPLQAEIRPNPMIPASHSGPISITKPIPPPSSIQRNPDLSSRSQRVVYPPKESCYNLPIMFPSIPEGGTKSRVETQIRVTLELADPSSSSDPFKYDRVGNWKWIRLPPGTATKKRTRKQGKIDPDPEDVLQLAVSVTCASPPHNRVLSCSSCQVREAKRVAKKLAARVRPAKSESESDGEGGRIPRKHHEDTTNIIQFNCAEIIDFEGGTTVLPLRITCYCRHHREKVGFNVHFTLTDHTGRLVGSGMSRPIMITDDHKTTGANAQRNAELAASLSGLQRSEWSQERLRAQMPVIDTRAPSKRKKDSISSMSGKPRPKPYDAANKSKKTSREGSVASIPSPSVTYSSLPTRSPTPSVLQNLANAEVPSAFSQPPPLQPSAQSSETSSPDTLATPLDNNSDVFIPELPQSPQVSQDLLQAMSQHAQQQQTQPPISMPINIPSMMIPPQAHSMPFLLFDTNQSSQSVQLQLPTIHRLIPNMGPTHGGIEVTILGANFHSSLQLNCVFGDSAASSTQRWSENTLVCMLPPRAAPGVVAVWFEGFPKVDDHLASPPSLFTYSDESDRALMELALQVVGLKMTGKIEDAKNVAMRIVGTAGSENSGSQSNTSAMQLASTFASTGDFGSTLLRPNETSNLEKKILDLLALLDTPLDDIAASSLPISQVLSIPSKTGQTLLHLATFLQFPALVRWLIDHDIDIDARDRNGYTALHFAALVNSSECAKILVEAGADQEIVNSLGKIPREIAPEDFFDVISITISEDDRCDSEDEEADWGDGEEDAVEELRSVSLRRRASTRALRRSAPTSSRATPHDISRAVTPPLPPPTHTSADDSKSDVKKPLEKPRLDEKQAASFVEKMIQRTLAQLPAQGLFPQLPHLPDLPNMPWAALPQIPMVFPVFVPTTGWPSFLGGESASEDSDKGEGDRKVGTSAMRAAHDWWEKWVAMAAAATAKQQQHEELPPPVYTARPSEGETTQKRSEAVASAVEETVTHVRQRPSAAEVVPTPPTSVVEEPSVSSGQESESIGYRPIVKRKPKGYKKNDRMLMWFWLPILFLSMVWALHTGARFAFQTIKTVSNKSTMSH
ncbi:hypothetical protein CC2G_008935 [Coprinopsis cinerea AmutBmut pab1-1]|nr:hypothetical protein CC2G_008935 [Coprinopsis cinerea AmutBmut pab1-1]